MNKTSLQHLTTLCRIYAAMRMAVKFDSAQYVINKKGLPFLYVKYYRGDVNAFRFHYKGQDVTSLVLSVLRMQEGF